MEEDIMGLIIYKQWETTGLSFMPKKLSEYQFIEMLVQKQKS